MYELYVTYGDDRALEIQRIGDHYQLFNEAHAAARADYMESKGRAVEYRVYEVPGFLLRYIGVPGKGWRNPVTGETKGW